MLILKIVLNTYMTLDDKETDNGVYDAIIAATCMVYDLPLWTHNKKDFKFLDIKLV